MTLDDLTLHPRTRTQARHYAKRLPQGLVIDGPVGSGVLAVAKALARNAGSPEFVIKPKKKAKTEWVVDEKEGSVIIDDVRQLYEQTRVRQPGEQVYIIDTGEKSMTISAQNAFLKLLEEPHSGIHFIIVTHQPDLLLQTIISRSQHLSLLAVTDEQTSDLIKSLGITDATKRARLAFVGRGRPALIKRLAGDDSLYESRVKIMSDAKTMLGSDLSEKLRIIHSYKDDRAGALTLVDDMNHQLRTIIRSQPDARLAQQIDSYLQARDRIAAGGNIRLQLTAGVL